jgi:hypothetical protein
MKMLKSGLLLAVLLGTVASGSAWAGHGHGHWHGRGGVGVVIGGPLFWPSYPYYPGPYYGAPVVVTPPAPPVYVEQGQGQDQDSADQYWYFCRDPQGYYPYVKTCPSGWQTVTPQPSDRPQ